MQRIGKYASVAPGLLIAVAVAAAARFLEGLLPIHLIGASVIALFIGMITPHSAQLFRIQTYLYEI